MITTPSFIRNSSPRRYLSRRSSSDSSTSDTPDSTSPHQATTITSPTTSRTNSNNENTTTPQSESSTGTDSDLFNPMMEETDAQCWQRMLRLQREYHCYNSARLSAAVEAEERGELEVAIPSRLCLDLLNESLRDWIEAQREGYFA